MENNFINAFNTKDTSNLTELNAADDVNRGFMMHADWFAHILRYGIIKNIIDKNNINSILDVGCGRLQLPIFLYMNRTKFCGKYIGLDARASKNWLEYINSNYNNFGNKFNIDLIKINIVKDNYDINKHDLVVCTEVLEHIPKDCGQILINKLYNWTSNNGWLIFSTPNAGVSDTVAHNHCGPDGCREWEYNDKIKLIEDAGYVIEDKIGTFIKLDKIKSDFWNKDTKYLKNILPSAFFRTYAALLQPEKSNNALFICRKRKQVI